MASTTSKFYGWQQRKLNLNLIRMQIHELNACPRFGMEICVCVCVCMLWFQSQFIMAILNAYKTDALQ